MADVLYIHLHIPKTAGYTFRYHIQKTLKSDEHLLLSYELLGLNMFNPPSNFKVYKEAVWKYLSKLSKNRLNKIKIVHGHIAPFGIHEFFDREVRYITFIRNPIDRTLSVYNFLVDQFKKEGYEKRKRPYYDVFLLYKGNVPDFDTWLKKKYSSDKARNHLTIAGYLQKQGFLGNGNFGKEDVSSYLKKFFFVGLTRTYNQESLYFFKMLGIHRYFIDQNITNRSFSSKLNKAVKQNILKANFLDQIVFNKAVAMNRDFKISNNGYSSAVFWKSLERKLVLPFSQMLFAPRTTVKRFWYYLNSGLPIHAEPTFFSKSTKT